MKRDRIFYAACGISALGVLFAALGSDFSFLFFVAAYLLRPVLTEFGLGAKFADEREQAIHAKSGDVAFIVVILAAIGYCLLRIAHGQRPEELYELIAIGLAARALTGLLMTGEYRKAGMLIIGAIGFFLGLFIILEGGFSTVSFFGAGIALLFFGIAKIAKRYPRVIAALVLLAIAFLIYAFELYHFRLVHSALWLLCVLPLSIASACLFLGSGNETEGISRKLRFAVFGTLSACTILVFTLLMLFGSRENRHTITFQQMKAGETKNIQGFPISGTVNYFENGKVCSAILAQDYTFQGNAFPAGTQLSFSPDGTLKFVCLPCNTYLQDCFCKGEGPGNWQTVFYPNGQLKLMWPAKDQWVQGIPCREASFWTDVFGGGTGVSFHANGKLQRCKLSLDFTIEGRSVKRGAHVDFDDQGHLLSVH
jgi:hypothetical protein